ncbi:tail fiber assembly protein [Enterobacter mori]|uniref:tail fiber assembly protein n=1 Tax=Enterobacter mori TaxID=539813 RepID=UPI00034AE9B2|nr:tail fiber assembly protein [Enterobacter mori]MBW8248074.1 tail fiber assembly protein [Enterobacter mori]MBW8252892.1 tail fiber assembly protein [Enterobacter mori]QXM21679.1 tail fiber assembly protein [Enterobacter mori]HDR2541850.1 tail fiber assembly protein [Enterobacter mori]
MLMKNFTASTKKLDGFTVMAFTDEDGNDWYASQTKFSATSLKFMFDGKGNIVAASWDASMLAPENLSVSEIEKNSVPENFFEPEMRWVFDGEKITPFVYSHEELLQLAKDELERLLSEAREKIVVPQTRLMAGRTLTEGQLNLLNAWLDYIDALEVCDITVLPVSFPNPPQ